LFIYPGELTRKAATAAPAPMAMTEAMRIKYKSTIGGGNGVVSAVLVG
jgi:hypothetical protein